MQAAARSIVLIGFMGTGKSSVGRRLGLHLGWPCHDTDEMIAASFGMAIERIFAELGEESFRNAESAVLRELQPLQPSIIVTGGGAVLRPENLRRLQELGTVVCLTADLATLGDRLEREPGRPLLRGENPAQTIEGLLR